MVKRYSFDEGDEAYYDAQGFLPAGYANLVLASDYDELEKLIVRRYGVGDPAGELIRLQARIRSLEAALRSVGWSDEMIAHFTQERGAAK